MSKKYTNKELTAIIKDIMLAGYSYIADLAERIREIEAESGDEDTAEIYNQLMNKLAVTNEILHFGHKISLQMFTKESHPFIEECMRQRETSINMAKKMSSHDNNAG